MSEPTDLRLIGRTSEGSELELVDHSGNAYHLRVSDTLRALINQPRLSAVADVETTITTTVKEVQARLRAGETIDAISRTTDWPMEKIENYAGPILQEREYILNQARSAGLRKDSTRLDISFLEAVVSKLVPRGVDADDLSWNTWRLPDATWHIELNYPNRDGNGVATWNFDTSRRTINPTDDNGAWLIGEEAPARVIEPGYVTAEPTHPSRVEPVAPV
jgi:hypothetical protein